MIIAIENSFTNGATDIGTSITVFDLITSTFLLVELKTHEHFIKTLEFTNVMKS